MDARHCPTTDMIAPAPVDPTRYRSVIGAFATGVAVVTAASGGALYGMTMNAVTSVSLDPCLLLVCPRRNSMTGRAIVDSGMFAVNILGSDQAHLSRTFMSPVADRFDGIERLDHPSGVPVLRDCAAYLVCELAQSHVAGDHDILLGKVVDCGASEAAPLVFHRGAYRRLA